MRWAEIESFYWNIEENNAARNMHNRGLAPKVADGKEGSFRSWVRVYSCCILEKNLALLCTFVENLGEPGFKRNTLISSVKKEKLNIQLSLVAYLNTNSKIQHKYQSLCAFGTSRKGAEKTTVFIKEICVMKEKTSSQ